MPKNDVQDRSDINDIVTRFYEAMLKDSIIGYIFTDVAKIDLAHHLPLIVDFWEDSLFRTKHYSGNTLQKHLDVSAKLPLTPGHFTRWLFLFNRALDDSHAGPNVELMKYRAEMVAKAISATITDGKRADMKLILGD